jgi:predicted nucleic acid-binding protein
MIVDASVAAKWVLFEDYSEQASLLLSQYSQLFAPEIINLEVVSAITKKHRMGVLPENLARKALVTWQEYIENEAIILLDNQKIWQDAKNLAIALPHAFPDCLYIALAKQKKMPLITADKILVEKAKAHYSDIVTLNKFSVH